MKLLTSLLSRGINLKMTLLKRTLIAFIAICLLVLVANLDIRQVEASPLPTGIVYSVSITLTNTQSVDTPAPFQQMITVNSAALSAQEAPNLQNVEFFDANGIVLPSWLESGNSSTSTNTIYWLKLPNGIPASSSITINMGFASPSVNLLNTQTTGEAPQLSPSYGQYDNGSSIFDSYDNFAGSSLNSNNWNSGGTIIVNNGVLMVTNTGAFITSVISKSDPQVLEYYGWCDIPTSSGSNRFGGVASLNNARLDDSGQTSLFWNQGGTGSVDTWGKMVSGTYTQLDAVSEDSLNDQTFKVYSILMSSSNSIVNLFTNYTNWLTTTNSPTTPTSGYFGVGIAGSGGTGQYVQWFRTRVYPPNGVMPIASGMVIPSPTSPPTLVSITVIPVSPYYLVAGSAQEFMATGNYSDGSHQDLSTQVTWNSSDPSIATISNSDLANGISAGNTNITASLFGIISNAVNLTVVATQPPAMPIGEIAGQPNLSVPIGGQTNWIWTILDGGDSPLDFQISIVFPYASITGTETPTVSIMPMEGMIGPHSQFCLTVTVSMPNNLDNIGNTWNGYLSASEVVPSSNGGATIAPGVLKILTVTAMAPLKANPVFSSLSSPTVTYGTASTNFKGAIGCATLIPSGNISITLNGVTQQAPINPNTGAFDATVITGNLDTAGSPYTVTYSYSGDTNFNSISDSKTLIIISAPLTVLAGNAARQYGEPNPVFTGLITGIQNNDPITATYNSIANLTSIVDTYPIVPTLTDNGSGKLADYAVISNNGTLTVNPTPLTIVAKDISKTYGATVTFSGNEFTSNGLLNSDMLTSVTLTSTGATATAAVSDSPYSIVPSAAVGNGLVNYSISYINGKLMVNATPLTVMANDMSKVYSTSLPTFTATATGLVNGDVLSSLGTLQFSTVATQASSVGTYSIIPSGLTSTNYKYAYVNGTLTVTPASTITTVLSSANPSVYGQSVTLTANAMAVSPAIYIPSGNVTFIDTVGSKTTPLGTVNLIAGKTIYATSTLPVGTNTITAVYSGEANFTTSTGMLTQTVESARDLKTDAVTELQNTKTGDRDIDNTTARATDFINDSLSSNLWVNSLNLVFQQRTDWYGMIEDRFENQHMTLRDQDIDDEATVSTECINGYGNGITVFHQEGNAAQILETSLKNYQQETTILLKAPKLNADQKADLTAMQKVMPIYQSALNDLLQADKVLTSVAIMEAKAIALTNKTLANIVTNELSQANSEFSKASTDSDVSDAIYHDGHAWFHAEMAIYFATVKLPTPSTPHH